MGGFTLVYLKNKSKAEPFYFGKNEDGEWWFFSTIFALILCHYVLGASNRFLSVCCNLGMKGKDLKSNVCVCVKHFLCSFFGNSMNGLTLPSFRVFFICCSVLHLDILG